MFILVDDNLINMDDISLIEPHVDNTSIKIFYRSAPETATTVKYSSTDDMVNALRQLVDITNAKSIPGTI